MVRDFFDWVWERRGGIFSIAFVVWMFLVLIVILDTCLSKATAQETVTTRANVRAFPEGTTPGHCADGVDNDLNTFVDCTDPNCHRSWRWIFGEAAWCRSWTGSPARKVEDVVSPQSIW